MYPLLGLFESVQLYIIKKIPVESFPFPFKSVLCDDSLSPESPWRFYTDLMSLRETVKEKCPAFGEDGFGMKKLTVMNFSIFLFQNLRMKIKNDVCESESATF